MDHIDTLVKRLRAYSQSLVAYKLDADFADACTEAAEELERHAVSNEPLTLISMSDELPPDNERVLVYRPLMVDSDIGPYSVQWGWAAKREASHWAHLPDLCPSEGEENKDDG